jgi:putative peptidoglycan lipid II flippase
MRSEKSTGDMLSPIDPPMIQARSTTSPAWQAKPAGRLPLNISILGAIASLAGATLAARALGIINQIVISAHFGAGAAMDAYFATFAVPTFISDLVVSAVEASLIPLYIRLSNAGQEREATNVLSTLINILALALGGLMALMLLFPHVVVRIFAPGIPAETEAIAVTLAPLLFPTMLLNTFVGFITCLLIAQRRFALPAFSGMLLPMGTIVGTVLLGNTFGISALALGLVVGTVCQLLVLVFMAYQARLHYRPVLLVKHRNLLFVLAQFWPMCLGAAISDVNTSIDQVVASLLGTGSISALNYALKVISIPSSIIFSATSRAVLPFFSDQAADRDITSLKETLRFFVWLVGLVTAAGSILCFICADLIVTLLFRHGAFTEQDAQLTASVLKGFSFGLAPMALGFLIPQVYSALNRNDLLLKITIYTLVTNVALDILLAYFFGLPGIALGTSIDYFLTTILKIAILRMLIGPLDLLKPPPQLFRLLYRPFHREKRG